MAFRGPNGPFRGISGPIFWATPDFIILKEISAKKILCPGQDSPGPAISTPIHHTRWPVFRGVIGTYLRGSHFGARNGPFPRCSRAYFWVTPVLMIFLKKDTCQKKKTLCPDQD